MNKQNNFNRATVPVNNRSRHNMGNTHITTAPFGHIIPIYTVDLIPGDTVNYHPKIFIRTPAAQTATFGQVRVLQASFFVPIRTLWSEWESFITGGLDGLQVYSKPYMTIEDLFRLSAMEPNTYKMMDLYDATVRQNWDNVLNDPQNEGFVNRGYFSDLLTNLGINVYVGTSHDNSVDYTNTYKSPIMSEKIDITVFRAYQKIWWDYFRDSVLIPEAARNTYIHTDSGIQSSNLDWQTYGAPQDIIDMAVNFLPDAKLNQVRTRHIAYKKDYFTTAKVNPQVGQASLVPVDLASSTLNPGMVYPSGGTGSSLNANANKQVYTNYAGTSGVTNMNNLIGQFSIEVFRTMNALQRYAEKNMIVGTRPINLFLARYGYAPSAARYDMAELVGGDDRYLDWIQVTSTADTQSGQSGAALADVSAYGRLFFNGDKQLYTAHEHGYFMSVLAIMPVTGYCDGIDKMFQCWTKEDYFTPEYENLGFEAIANKELYASLFWTTRLDTDIPTGNPGTKYSEAFGFQERYSRYKWKRDVLAGDFVRYNTNVGGDVFHTFRRFNRIPSLNPDFNHVYVNQYGNNWNRLFVDENDDYNPFIIDIDNSDNMVRPMSGFAVPALSNVYEQDGRNITLPYGGVRM